MVVREYPASPVVAVGGVVIRGGCDGEREVLLILRAKMPSSGEWSIPGGAVEVGETLHDALRRELLEETGLTVRVGEMVEVLDRILRDEQGHVQFHYVLADFACAVESGDLAAATDVSAARWVARSEVHRFGLRPDTLRVIEKGFQRTIHGAENVPQTK